MMLGAEALEYYRKLVSLTNRCDFSHICSLVQESYPFASKSTR